MRKLMTATAVAMVISCVGVATVGAYARNTAPNLYPGATCNLYMPNVSVGWDKNYGKPANYSFEYPYLSTTISGSGKVPGSAGARAMLAIALDSTTPPASGTSITVTLSNSYGSDSVVAICP